MQNFKKLKTELPGIRKNILLANYTTFKIGGLAKYFYIAKTKKDLLKAVILAKKFKLPFFILGGGSNLLVADEGYKGLVIKVKSQKSKVKSNTIFSEAGVSLSSLFSEAEKNNLIGLEWAAGIPGTMGGAIRGNAGAFGSSMADVVKSVEVLDVKNLKTKKLKNKNCKFNYRNSIFKRNKNLIILSAEFQFKKDKKKEIENKIKEYLNHRKKTQPLNFPSAGSVFKNYESRIMNHELVKGFPELREFNKKRQIPAGYLIEKCDLKGKIIGNAQISEKHSNFIVNLGKAKARDVRKVINLAKEKVKNKFGVKLEEEIQFLGFKN